MKPIFTKTVILTNWMICFLFFTGNFSSFANNIDSSPETTCFESNNKPLTLGLSLSVQHPTCYGYTNGAIYTDVSGGTPPYYYLWDNNNSDTAPHLLGVGAGTYTVIVTDSNGDIVIDSKELVQPPDIVAGMTSTDAYCSIGGTATVTCSGGVSPYTYLWDNGETGTIATGLDPGLVSVTVTDATACVTIHSIAVGGTSSSSLGALIIDQEYTTCAISQNGYAEAKGFNGSGNYTYLWPDGQTTALATGLDVGTYVVTVTDDTGCEVTATAIIELHPEGVWVTVYGTDASCNYDDGSAIANAMLGTPPYTYLWSNGATTEVIDNLIPGSYFVTVTDVNGCTNSAGVYVDQDASDLTLFTTSSFETCDGSEDASATAVADGGNPPYTYTWSNGYVGFKNPNLGAGDYGVTVTDADGCSLSTVETVEISPEGVWLMVSGTDASCCGNDGTAHVSIMTGDPPFIVEWSDGQTGTIDPVGLAPGDYCVTVTDANGCSNSECLTIDATDQLSIDISSVNASCGNGSTGSATATPCINGNFSYQWSNGQSGQTATNLSAGEYDVTVTNSAGCQGVESVTIVNEGGNLVVLIDNIDDVSCFGGDDGSASVTASGGSGNYSYQWSDGQTGAIANNLSQGIITVVVSDDDTGCSGMASANINQPTELTISLTSTNVTCSGINDGSAQVSTSGGTGPYSYDWSNGSNSSSNNNLSSGTYSVTVTDANGCSISESTTIEDGSTVIVFIENLVAPTCNGYSDGSASASQTGGNPPYTYAWSNGETTGNITGLPAGTISVTITDNDGCYGTASATLDEPTELEVSLSATDETCGGGNDGSVSSNPSGGTPPYSYLWSNGASTANLVNLAPGSYNLTLSDANGCMKVTPDIIVNTGTTLNVTTSPTFVSCFNATDGTISANVSGGTGNYTYLWNTGATTESLDNLPAGTYEVTVSDSEGCMGIASGIILEPTLLEVNPTGMDESCIGSSNGEAYANASGGTAPYTYNWSTGETSPFLLNLPAGTYSVTVTDSNNCTTTGSYVVSENGIASCTASVSSSYNEGVDISTLGGSDGSATVSASGGASPLSYSWSDGQSGADATGLSAGTYTITVTDDEGCTCTSSVTLNDPAKIGNLIWEDINKNGIQDVGEPGIEGVIVILSGSSSLGVDVNRTMNTASTGMYMFDGLPPGSYKVTFEKPDGYQPTNSDAGGDDNLDSDADESTGMTGFYTLDHGDYDPSVDAGFFGCVTIGDFVWNDLDKDGLQDINDGGFPNMLVRLYDLGPDGIPCNADDYLVDFETTNTQGLYQFECVEPGSYYIQFVHPGIPSTYMLSPANQGTDDEIDSDADPTTGKTPVFTIVPGQADDFSFDAGLSPNCNNVNNGGQIGYSQTVCAGLPADTLVNTVNPTGGSGDLEYIWLFSPTGSGPIGSGDWTEIPNSNNPFYFPGVVPQTTFYVRCVRRVGCNSYYESNFVEVEVVPYDPNLCGSSPMFINFDGTIINEDMDVQLNWTTDEENDFYNFYIEHSIDNETFEVVGSVSGAGMGTENNQYEFMDYSLSDGLHYYRIKAVGLQSLHYSEQIRINVRSGVGDLILYPNPATKLLNIEAANTLSSPITLEIYNSIGQLIDKLRMDNDNPMQTYDLVHLSTGTYIIKMKFDNEQESQIYKFLKRQFL